MALISCAVTAQLICVFVFAYAQIRVSHEVAHIIVQVMDDFVQSTEGTNVSIISQEIFQHHPEKRVQNLKVSPSVT